MTLLAALVALVRDDAAMAAIQGERVSENSAPQGQTFPRTVIEANDRSRAMSHGGQGGTTGRQMASVRFQLQAKGKGPPEAMRERLLTLLNGYRGTLGSGAFTVQGAFEKGAPDEFDVAINDGEFGVFVVAPVYDVHYHATA